LICICGSFGDKIGFLEGEKETLGWEKNFLNLQKV
jgi:hypothetical protein